MNACSVWTASITWSGDTEVSWVLSSSSVDRITEWIDRAIADGDFTVGEDRVTVRRESPTAAYWSRVVGESIG